MVWLEEVELLDDVVLEEDALPDVVPLEVEEP